MNALTPDEVTAAFNRALRDLGGDLDGAALVVYGLGQRAGGIVPPRRLITNAESLARSVAAAEDSADFLRRRWQHLFTAVAERHGTEVRRLTPPSPKTGRPKGMTASELQGSKELCWLLVNVAKLSVVTVGVVLRRHHTSVIQARDKINEQIAARPELREELMALAKSRQGKVAA